MKAHASQVLPEAYAVYEMHLWNMFLKICLSVFRNFDFRNFLATNEGHTYAAIKYYICFLLENLDFPLNAKTRRSFGHWPCEALVMPQFWKTFTLASD